MNTPKHAPTVKCNNCDFKGCDNDLLIIAETPENKEDRGFFKGCPNCKTDDYLMDIEVLKKEKPKHTPGPWLSPKSNLIFAKGGNIVIAVIANETHSKMCVKDDEEKEANAKLIAAAPDMLRCLQKLADTLPEIASILYGDGNRKNADMLEKQLFNIQDVISKATE